MSITEYVIGVLAAWGALDLCRRLCRLWIGTTRGKSIYNDPDAGRF